MAIKHDKPEIQIRKLKKEIDKLRKLCTKAGVPLLIVYLPELVVRGMDEPSPQKMRWLKEKIKEYEQIFKNA